MKTAHLSRIDTFKMYRDVAAEGGTWDDMTEKYRQATNATVSDNSIYQRISGQIKDLKNELSARGLSDEQVAEQIPSLKRKTAVRTSNKAEEISEVLNFLQQIGQM